MPLAMSLMTELLMGMTPPFPSIFSMTPCQNRRPARVTMNDGRPTLVMIVPWSAPIAAHARSARMIAAHHGQPIEGLTSSAMTTPPIPPTKPIDRSISPRSRAKTSPIASRLNTAAWTSRLTRLPASRKWEFSDWNRIETRSRPPTTGRTPLSPALTRASEARR